MEKRKAERFPLHLRATVRTQGVQEPPAHHADEDATVENISSRGALFSSAGRWKKEEKVALEVSMDRRRVSPYRYDISIAGRIVRERSPEHGDRALYAVEFDETWNLINWEECETA